MSEAESPEPAAETGTLVFRHRARPIGPETVLTLDATSLAWRSGQRRGRVALDEVEQVRLAFRPANLNFKRYLVTVKGKGGQRAAISNLSWRSMIAAEDKSAAFSDFVRELHRRIARAGAKATFVSGIGWVRFIGAAAMAGVVLVTLAIFAARFATEEVGAWKVALFTLLFGGVFMWQMGTFVLRNRPRRYDPEAIPDMLLPKP